MEPESSLPHSQVFFTCPYPEPTQSSLHPLPLPEAALYRLLIFHVPKKKSLFLLRDTSPRNIPPRRSEWGSSLPPDCFVSRGSISPCEYFLTMFFHGEALAPRPTPKPEDHPSSVVRDCLFNIFAATLHIGGRSSIRNLTMRRAVVTGTHLSRNSIFRNYINFSEQRNSGRFAMFLCHWYFFKETYCKFCKNTIGCIKKFCATEIQVSIHAVGSVMRCIIYHIEMCH